MQQVESASNPQSRSFPPPNARQSSGTPPRTASRPPLREQIAFQPPSRPPKPAARTEPPAWMNQLDHGGAGNARPPQKIEVQTPEQLDFSISEMDTIHTASRTANAPARELHVKVWEEEQELPTAPLAADAKPSTRPPSHAVRDAHLDELEQLETRPLVSHRPANGASSSSAAKRPSGQSQGVVWETAGPVQRPVMQGSPSPLPLARPEMQPAHDSRQTPQSLHTPPASLPAALRTTRSRRKSRTPLVFMLALLCLLVGGGLVAWIALSHPFAVPAITKTAQPFQNTALDISLQYPQGWTASVEQQNTTVSFYDSSHTGQVNIFAASTNGQSMDQYMKKEAAQLGITGQASVSPLAFAGASWQQLKGSVVQQGATYSVVLLLTQHSDRFYSIVQLAPPAVYNEEEQLVFSPLRSSFQFLS